MYVNEICVLLLLIRCRYHTQTQLTNMGDSSASIDQVLASIIFFCIFFYEIKLFLWQGLSLLVDIFYDYLSLEDVKALTLVARPQFFRIREVMARTCKFAIWSRAQYDSLPLSACLSHSRIFPLIYPLQHFFLGFYYSKTELKK